MNFIKKVWNCTHGIQRVFFVVGLWLSVMAKFFKLSKTIPRGSCGLIHSRTAVSSFVRVTSSLSLMPPREPYSSSSWYDCKSGVGTSTRQQPCYLWHAPFTYTRPNSWSWLLSSVFVLQQFLVLSFRLDPPATQQTTARQWLSRWWSVSPRSITNFISSVILRPSSSFNTKHSRQPLCAYSQWC